jgi:hypothetical protein
VGREANDWAHPSSLSSTAGVLQPQGSEHMHSAVVGSIALRVLPITGASALARLQPVHSGGVDGNRLLWRDVGSVLEVVVLPLLLALEVEPRQPTQVLAAHSLVHCSRWLVR